MQLTTLSKQSLELEELSEELEAEVSDNNEVQITNVTSGTKHCKEYNKPLENIRKDKTTPSQKTPQV